MSLIDSLSNDLYRAQTTRGLVAKVTAVGATTVDVEVGGSTVAGVPVSSSYLGPAVDDVALILKIGSAWVAVTALGGPGEESGVPTDSITLSGTLTAAQVDADQLTGFGATFRANTNADGTAPGYTPVDVIGSKGGYSGFRFVDNGLKAMYSPGATGVYRDDGTWVYYFDSSGRLEVGAAKRIWNDANDMVFHWSGQGGQPTWLWGGSDGVNMYVYNPANFSVNAVGGYTAGALCRVNENNYMTNSYPFTLPNLTVGSTYGVTLSSGMVMQRNGSSARYKREIADLERPVADLWGLRPRQYHYDNTLDEVDADDDLQGGFIAEEVAEVYPEAVVFDAEGRPDDVKDRALIAGVLALVHDLKADLDAAREQIAALEARL